MQMMQIKTRCRFSFIFVRFSLSAGHKCPAKGQDQIFFSSSTLVNKNGFDLDPKPKKITKKNGLDPERSSFTR